MHLRERARQLAPWYQNIELAPGVWTRDFNAESEMFSGHEIPGPLWELIARDLPDLHGQRVLDIGCNAGYMSFQAKRLGAEWVDGIDSNLGAAPTSFLEQAEFCRDVLGLDVAFHEASIFDFEPPDLYGLIFFCGVLYHLEDFATALDRLATFVTARGLVVIETAIAPITRTFPGTRAYNGDTTTYFVPSLPVLTTLLLERGWKIPILRDLNDRALAFVQPR